MSVFVSIEAMIMVGKEGVKDVNEKVKNEKEKEEEKELDKEVENGI